MNTGITNLITSFYQQPICKKEYKNEVMRLMMCDNPFSTEVVLLKKLGRNEDFALLPDSYRSKPTVNTFCNIFT
jgi:hypothetical protein